MLRAQHDGRDADLAGRLRGMKRIKVLCAMRDARVVRELRWALDERCDFIVETDGVQAYKRALSEAPDVLVLDAVLPSLDGVGLVEKLWAALGDNMPCAIGGSVGRFADGELARAGIKHLLDVPWQAPQLVQALETVIEDLDAKVDWERARTAYDQARRILCFMGMNEKLRGFTYLAWAGALTGADESRLYAIGEKLYIPIAQHEHATPQAVERLIRHAVERTTDTVGEMGIYAFFGNTIDPMRGKPTNAQMIAMLAQRIRCMKN